MLHLRNKRRWGADRIALETRLAPSTVQNILNQAGCGRLDRGDRATNHEPVVRDQRDRPGELIHVDIKKIAGIPAGGGWQLHGRGNADHHSRTKAGYRYIHTALDDRTRLVYSEIHLDEQRITVAAFWQRAAAWFALHGIVCERVITDNGACYKSRKWHAACAKTGTTVKKTRPYRPQTNGKVERFHRILLEEWAYIRAWTSDAERTELYGAFIHFYNHHRPHGALGWSTPAATANTFRDNLPGEHNEHVRQRCAIPRRGTAQW